MYKDIICVAVVLKDVHYFFILTIIIKKCQMIFDANGDYHFIVLFFWDNKTYQNWLTNDLIPYQAFYKAIFDVLFALLAFNDDCDTEWLLTFIS